MGVISVVQLHFGGQVGKEEVIKIQRLQFLLSEKLQIFPALCSYYKVAAEAGGLRLVTTVL